MAVAQQTGDPDYKATVAHPMFVRSHPRVLFDEGHHNAHSLGNRYKAFGELLKNDGYEVLPNKALFSAETLKGVDVLVIANARGQGSGFAQESLRAFSMEECDALRDWVKSGGSLLLIADHAPMGSANEVLALRFGVQMSKAMSKT